MVGWTISGVLRCYMYLFNDALLSFCVGQVNTKIEHEMSYSTVGRFGRFAFCFGAELCFCCFGLFIC